MASITVNEAEEAGDRFRAWRRLKARRGALVGLVVVSAFVLIAAFAPWLAPYDPLQTNFLLVRKPASAAHWLGTDEIGRDILSRLIFGARASLMAGVISVAIACGIGVPV